MHIRAKSNVKLNKECETDYTYLSIGDLNMYIYKDIEMYSVHINSSGKGVAVDSMCLLCDFEIDAKLRA